MTAAELAVAVTAPFVIRFAWEIGRYVGRAQGYREGLHWGRLEAERKQPR